MRVIKLFILICAIQWIKFGLSGQSEVRFSNLSRVEGLSDNNVNAILQDRYGFMWFGTQEGLCRFDGFTFTNFYSDPSNTYSPASSNITSIYQSTRGDLWVGTIKSGISRFDPLRNKFVNYFANENLPYTLNNNHVSHITGDRKGNLWIATLGGGLNYYDALKEQFTVYSRNLSKNTISSNDVNVVELDKNGNLWIGTNTHLDFFDTKSETFHHYILGYESYDQNKKLSIRTLYIDKDNLVWVGTSGGLYTFDPSKKIFKKYTFSLTDKYSISDEFINAIYPDSYGNIWIGTNNGLSKYLPAINGFENYSFSILDNNVFRSNRVECIYEDRSNILWIGTRGGGVNKLDLKRKKFYGLSLSEGTKQFGSNYSVISLMSDTSDNVWIGTDGGGSFIFNRKKNETETLKTKIGKNPGFSDDQITAISRDKGKIWIGTKLVGLACIDQTTNDIVIKKYRRTNDSTGISNNQVNSILIDREGFVWIGTRDGLNKKSLPDDNGREYFTVYRKSYTSTIGLSDNHITSLYQDHRGFIWIGTNAGGLNRLNPASGSIEHFLSEPDNPKSIGSNTINTIFEDHFGVIWVGTSGGGLNMLNSDNITFTRFSVKDGLPGNDIMSILEDYAGWLWIGTSKGLSKFDPISRQFINFDLKDGLLNDGFQRSAAVIDQKGRMYFGTYLGLVYFYPHEILLNPHKPEIIITKFTFLKDNVWADNDFFISRFNAKKNNILLEYDKNLFSVEFAAMDFTNPERNQYEYKIEGINTDWLPNGNKRVVMVTNLKPGKYTLRVRGTNNDGLLNEEGIALAIEVKPPFWRTNAFYFILFIVIALLGFLAYSYLIKWNTNKILAVKNEELEQANQRLLDSEKSLKELNNTKDKFFSIIAHDLRNPFNPLLALTELLENDYKELKEEERISFIREIHLGAKKLYDLLENLLNWALSQTKQIKFHQEELNLFEVVKSNVELLEINAVNKGISIINNIRNEAIVLADENMLNSILRNLINNAIKFSHANSRIEINIYDENQYFIVEVKDSGHGIAIENQMAVFNGFLKSEKNKTKGKGTGLGLILCKEFVEKNKGEIWVKSDEGKGASFFFTLQKAENAITSN
jgi:ligand-binding sensor domain-containing protein/signal transduction histidine kinase